MKLEINVTKHYDADAEWISAEVEDGDVTPPGPPE